jgi:hypothetical protein
MKVKGLILLMTIVAAPVGAETLTTLEKPQALNGYSTGHCAGLSFGAGDAISGNCLYYTVSGGGGRGSNHTYTYQVFATTWDNTAALTASAQCGTAVKPGVLAMKWTYLPGYSAANCALPPTSEMTYVLRYGSNGYQQWYGYISASVDGAFELLLNGFTGTLGAF